jgi:hypothetical protein
MRARELACDGEPEPSAAELLRGCGVGLAELLEQLCLLLMSYANAGVSDREETERTRYLRVIERDGYH